ncbi:hypothetical protein BKA67DRAFT_571969, partial [Truncatella angustata]
MGVGVVVVIVVVVDVGDETVLAGIIPQVGTRDHDRQPEAGHVDDSRVPGRQVLHGAEEDTAAAGVAHEVGMVVAGVAPVVISNIFLLCTI